MRGPVGSLARPETLEEFEACDAGVGVTVHVHRALLGPAVSGTITFEFGLLGRCTLAVDDPPH